MRGNLLTESKTNRAEDLKPRNGLNKYFLISVAILIILVVIAYSGAGKNNFVGWDDNDYVVNNPLVRNEKSSGLKEIFSTVVSLNYHPVTILSLRLNNNTCNDCPDGIASKPFIINNIILHLLNTILVFILVYVLFRNNLLLAFLVAAIFAVHPMHVESVAWISGRKDVLNSFFFLSGLISYIIYIKAEKSKYLWLLLAFILFILACLSKATAVVFPVILLLIDYFIIDDESAGSSFRDVLKSVFNRRILPLLPFFAVSLFFGLMAVHLQNGQNFLGMLKFSKAPEDVVNIVGPFSVLQRIQIACYGFFVYFLKFFIPLNQSPFYPYPDLNEISHGYFALFLWISLLAMLVTVTAVIISTRKTRLYIFCFGFYLVTLALTLHFVSVGKAIIAERYTYLPYISLAVIPAWFITRSGEKTKRLFLIISGIFIITMLILTRNQIRVWHDTSSLWTQVIEKYPDLELARRARGKYYYMLSAHAKNLKEKEALENRAIADFNVAIGAKTASPDVYEGMGVILQSRKELKKALQFLDVAVKLNPQKGRTYYNRAMVHDQLNQKDEAITDYESALRLSPDMSLEILKNRSVLYIETGRFDKAISDLDELVKIDGRDFSNYYNRAFAKVMLKDYEGAVIDYKIVLLLNPGDKATIEQLRVLQEYRNKK